MSDRRVEEANKLIDAYAEACTDVEMRTDFSLYDDAERAEADVAEVAARKALYDALSEGFFCRDEFKRITTLLQECAHRHEMGLGGEDLVELIVTAYDALVSSPATEAECEELAAYCRTVAADARTEAGRARKYAMWLQSDEAAAIPESQKMGGTAEDSVRDAEWGEAVAVKYERMASLLSSAVREPDGWLLEIRNARDGVWHWAGVSTDKEYAQGFAERDGCRTRAFSYITESSPATMTPDAASEYGQAQIVAEMDGPNAWGGRT